MKPYLLTLAIMLMLSANISAQEKISLYPNGTPDSNGITKTESRTDPEFLVDISEPRMLFYPAPANVANGTSVLICPGGGYAGVADIKEGTEFAEWFNRLGISAFVLYYRMPNGHPNIPQEDVHAAMKIIYQRAAEWHLNKNKIGIMGFSAGGHLASTAGTHFKTKWQRPAFMILAYPVITMNAALTHMGSRENLLGSAPAESLVKYYSNELQVTKKTPPTFLVHAKDDGAVPIQNSEDFYQALLNHHVPATLKIYDKGGHGFGMRRNDIPVKNWTNELKIWLINEHLIDKQL